MPKPSSIIPALLLAIVAFSAGRALFSQIEGAGLDLEDLQREEVSRLSDRAKDELLARVGRIASNAREGRADWFLRHANLARSLGTLERTPERRLVYFCESLAAYGRAVEERPRNSLALAGWANMRQLLGRAKCDRPLTEGSFADALALALESDPHNTDVMYAAALLHYWSEDRSQVSELLGRVLTYETELSAGQQRFIADVIINQGAVLEIIPQRFPQAGAWSSYFRTNYRAEFERLSDKFAELQVRALQHSLGEFESGAIDHDLHFERLVSLFDWVANPTVRKVLDSELARALRRERKDQLADYFERRAQLSDLLVNTAFRASDTRPGRGQFTMWNAAQRVAFDSFHNSVGFYLARSQTPRLVELVTRGMPTLPAPSEVELYLSEDNINWDRVTSGVEIKVHQLADYVLISIETDGRSNRYWKVHFAGGERRGSFVNSADAMVRVFGLSARREGR